MWWISRQTESVLLDNQLDPGGALGRGPDKAERDSLFTSLAIDQLLSTCSTPDPLSQRHLSLDFVGDLLDSIQRSGANVHEISP